MRSTRLARAVRSAPTTQVPVSRRAFLAGSAGLAVSASLALPGCGGLLDPPDPPVTEDSGPSTRELVSKPPFYIASRAGARDWPEMTLYAFEQAAKNPAIQAMELIVCRTSDGALVCSADPTTTRLTGVDREILTSTWDSLSGLMVSARQTRNPAQPAQPLARLDDILDAYSDRFVFWVEPRVPAATINLMARLLAVGAPQRIVWKQPINSSRFGEAKQHGFSTWGYVLNEPAHTGRNLEKLAASPDIDMLGVSVAHPDRFVSGVVSAAKQNLKPTIGWNIEKAADVDRALRLGCQGLATLAISELNGER